MNKEFIYRQPKRHFRLGVAPWGQMKPECLVNLSNTLCDPGYELEILRIIMMLLNFTVEIKYSKSAGCGDIYKNGTTTGLLNMLYNNEIDIIGNLCLLDNTRTNITWLKHSWPVLHQRQAFLIKAPDVDTELHIFATFAVSVWLLMLLITFSFLTLFVVIYKVYLRQKLLKAIKKALKDTYAIIFGFYCKIVHYPWFYFLCFIGYSHVLYYTFFTIHSLKPADIERPFRDHAELVESLLFGNYKIVDYKSDPVIQCFTEEVCLKLTKAYEKHGTVRTKVTDPYLDSSNLLSSLMDNPNLVLVKSRHSLMTYLDQYRERSKLWLIDDELSSNALYTYFHSNNFIKLSELFDRAVMLIADGKDNINSLYYALSCQTIQTKKVTGKLSNKFIVDLNLLRWCWIFYFITITVSLLVFVIEIFLSKIKFF